MWLAVQSITLFTGRILTPVRDLSAVREVSVFFLCGPGLLRAVLDHPGPEWFAQPPDHPLDPAGLWDSLTAAEWLLRQTPAWILICFTDWGEPVQVHFRPGDFSGIARRVARDRHPQPLTGFHATVRTAREKSGFKAGSSQREKSDLERG